jgi:hypothetical protein
VRILREDFVEATLNLLWLVIALTAVWRWRFRWSVSRQDRKHSPKIEAVAMVCVLALLFPVISLTDDLHPETVAVDAPSGKRNACLIAAGATHVRATSLGSGTHHAVGIVTRPFGAICGSFSDLVLLPTPCKSNSLAASSAGRSPPSLS